MARDLTTAVAAAIAAPSVRPAVFYEGVYTTGTLRLWSGIGPIEWNGHTWTGAGQMIGVAPITEVSDIRAVGFSVSLSGEASALISANLSAARQGLSGKVWLGVFESISYVSLPGEAGDYLSTPDSAANSITGDIDIRAKVALDDWTPPIASFAVAKRTGSGNQRSYSLHIGTTGRINFSYSMDGVNVTITTSTVAPTVSNGAALWIRATADVDDGASPNNHVVTFYTSADYDPITGTGTWTQLGDVVTGSGAISFFNSTSPVELGSTDNGASGLLAGKVYYVEIRNGIGGPVVVKFDARRFSSSNTTMTAETGEVWTLNQSGSPMADIVHQGESLIADPFLCFAGRLDVPDMVIGGERMTIAVAYESRLIDLDRARERRYTSEDQKIDYPDDLGFDFVPALQDMQIVWGRPGGAPVVPPPVPPSVSPGTTVIGGDAGGGDDHNVVIGSDVVSASESGNDLTIADSGVIVGEVSTEGAIESTPIDNVMVGSVNDPLETTPTSGFVDVPADEPWSFDWDAWTAGVASARDAQAEALGLDNSADPGFDPVLTTDAFGFDVEPGLTTDAFGFDVDPSADLSAGISGTGGGAGGADKVICAELYRQGLMPQNIFEADERYGARQPRELIAGYHVWAEPIVERMRRSRRFTRLVWWIARPWALEMAFRDGALERGSLLGAAMMGVGEAYCVRRGRPMMREVLRAE